MRVGAIPLPVNAIVVGEFVALLITETPPVTLPAATGEKATVNVAFCPAARVRGTAKPPAMLCHAMILRRAESASSAARLRTPALTMIQSASTLIGRHSSPFRQHSHRRYEPNQIQVFLPNLNVCSP